jgi:hypothetical protein
MIEAVTSSEAWFLKEPDRSLEKTALFVSSNQGGLIGNAFRLLVGKPEGKRSLGRPRRRWKDNIKMDILLMELGVVDWIGRLGELL